jgi:hypothetical protein
MTYFGLASLPPLLAVFAYIGTPVLLLVFAPLWLLVPERHERPVRAHGGGGTWRVGPLLAKARHRLGRGGER